MKKTVLFMTFFALILRGVTTAQNPYESIGKKAKVLTLSNGKYQEIFTNDTIVPIGTVMYNRVTGDIVAFLTRDTMYAEYNLEPEVVSRWLSPDPLGAKFPEWSPYTYAENNPVLKIDPDGNFAIAVHYKLTQGALSKLGYKQNTSDAVGHYASTYADHPANWIANQQGHPFRNGVDYSKTASSQNTASADNSTWHSMKADKENISNEAAMKRGQEFGWKNIIDAAKDVKKFGGIDKLPENSLGLQSLGQGLHALQDAVAHKGTDMDNHSVPNDMSPTPADYMKAFNITESAVIAVESLSGNYQHLGTGMTLNFEGMSASQLKTVTSSLLQGMKDRNVDYIHIQMGDKTNMVKKQ
jgi:hypothetical protein